MTQTVLLVADDQEDNLVIFSASLTHHGYGFVLAASEQDAVELAREHSPKLILIDLQMPGMSGAKPLGSPPGAYRYHLLVPPGREKA